MDPAIGAALIGAIGAIVAAVIVARRSDHGDGSPTRSVGRTLPVSGSEPDPVAPPPKVVKRATPAMEDRPVRASDGVLPPVGAPPVKASTLPPVEQPGPHDRTFPVPDSNSPYEGLSGIELDGRFLGDVTYTLKPGSAFTFNPDGTNDG